MRVADMPAPHTEPNHHAGQGPFDGLLGMAVGLTMLFGRKPMARLACALGQVSPGDDVLDVGCGPGVAVRVARERGAAAAGVDPAESMLRLARWLSPSSVRYLRGSAEAIPAEDDSQDVIWSLATAHHWSDVDRGVHECHRALREGGRLVVIERLSHEGARGHARHGWTLPQAEAFASLVEGASFSSVAVRPEALRRGRVLAVVATA